MKTALQVLFLIVAATAGFADTVPHAIRLDTNSPGRVEPIAEPSNAPPRVLLIGDSICGGYEKTVKQLLAGKAEVVKNPGNAEHTGTGLKKLDEWLGDGRWDVIHFNWGLWDIAYRNPESKNFGQLDKVAGKLTTPLPEYEQNLRMLVARLRPTGAKLIWASITPVPEGEPGRIKGDEIRYNAVAAKIMAENGVAIDDLHSLAAPQLTKFQQSNNVHFTPAGYNLLAGQVADSILAALPNRKTAATQSKPNIVFFLADDLGYMDVGANNPKTFYETPNIDALAAKGMRFKQGYAACPVCSPTRASILTGKYPPRVGITDFIGAAQPEKWARPTKLLPAPYSEKLPYEEITLAEAFKAHGYATFFAGKWHLGTN